jgi:hypothetical protein
MPVTPSFTCWQDEEFVYLAVRVPWVRVGGMEFVLDGCNFSFFCKPCVSAICKREARFGCPDLWRFDVVYWCTRLFFREASTCGGFYAPGRPAPWLPRIATYFDDQGTC